MNYRQSLQSSTRWIIKVGSSLVTNQGQGLDGERIGDWVEQIIGLRQLGVTEIILVSSGAVAEGMVRLGWTQRPEAVYQLQAVAAVGQMGLIHAYESRFQHHGVHTAQVLLTHDDLANRQRYLNARSTFQELLKLGVVPIVNENDTVAVDEIRFGDNDTLAALVANLLAADALIILTDQPGMFNDDPHRNPQAQLIHEARAGDSQLTNIAAKGGVGLLGRGGMITKVNAAAYAARSGTTTVIASGKENNVLARLKTGETLGTLIYPDQEPLAARKQWLAASLQVCGRLILDDGAVRVIRKSGRSLLSAGIISVKGEFKRGDLVACSTQHGQDVARGLVNYNASEARKLIGKSSDQIQSLLGYVDEPEMIHRDNLVLV